MIGFARYRMMVNAEGYENALQQSALIAAIRDYRLRFYLPELVSASGNLVVALEEYETSLRREEKKKFASFNEEAESFKQLFDKNEEYVESMEDMIEALQALKKKREVRSKFDELKKSADELLEAAKNHTFVRHSNCTSWNVRDSLDRKHGKALYELVEKFIVTFRLEHAIETKNGFLHENRMINNSLLDFAEAIGGVGLRRILERPIPVIEYCSDSDDLVELVYKTRGMNVNGRKPSARIVLPFTLTF